ncbi:hypothetical protein DMN91_002846 [Ooceraea biroi]|uniref:Protein SPEC3 n=1 Tax=Ooceraea biroi TaxID=2015173 RepID=A0A3L8DWL1_OOCBI|nr:protein stum [Ooceraea biroi]RLU24756.1 hypothetical protein DMN91_002846 [Ooceraea biroi]
MRRFDHDDHVARQGPPPFRVLADTAYLSPAIPAPPPPRAPEPYKLAPSTTSFGRAHRRSSFVILAESRPASPEPTNASPTLPTGRVSPFRGRGFKGPPPHSMSRPQSPEVTGEGRRRRLERRVSVSQQNSPRRSLIPQPTYRQRSVSLTKANERLSSPKIGRRVDSKTRLNVSGSRGRLNAADSKSRLNDSRTRLNKSDSRSRVNLAEPRTRFISNSTGNLSSNRTPTRRQPTTRASTRLSPIQGTPTKPEKTNVRGERAKDSLRTSPTKTPRTTPRKNVVIANQKDNHQDRSPSKERSVSSSKIPLKKNKANGVSLASSNSGRFISMPEQNSEKPRRAILATKNENGQSSQSIQNGRSPDPDSRENGVDGSSGKVDEVHLMDLLKQTSHASGTSSERLVNTTTTTAVQPLHIDANTLLVERNETVAAGNQQRERHDGTSSKSSISPTPKDESSAVVSSAQNAGQKSTPLEHQTAKSSNPENDKKDSPVGAEGGTREHSKTSSFGQAARNVVRMNGESSVRFAVNQSSANLRVGRNGNTARVRPSDARPPDESEASSMTSEVKRAGGKVVAGDREVPASDKMPMMTENKSEMTRTTMAEDETRTNAEAMTNNRMANNATTMTIKSNSPASSAIGAVNASVNASGMHVRNANRGSDASLKSSTGVSTDSIESVRSTDTGVSVNTVRGVSSPREKTGVHVVKRQEIETLSGNIVHIEQNGEPAVLASGTEKQREGEKLLERWGRSLRHYCRCCSGMRCLACRRDPKGFLWARNQGRIINDSSPPVAATMLDAPPPATNASSCWSKLKTRCRCTRLREIKCCTRKSRVAPAESTAACCPPERRFGAICRRMFACCSCKRPDTQQQRTRNIRAKHSLTSVAPPPLSEEPKTKIPDVLVEHNSVMRGAIPCLPVPLAWFCLIWNVLLPGTGTVWSGLFNLCTGQPRFSASAGMKSRLGAFIVNLVVGVGQLFTVLFCLVGWGWSIWWGITMVRLARKYKRFKVSEAASNDPEARGSGEPAGLPPAGAPSQALRGMERAR